MGGALLYITHHSQSLKQFSIMFLNIVYCIEREATHINVVSIAKDHLTYLFYCRLNDYI